MRSKIDRQKIVALLGIVFIFCSQLTVTADSVKHRHANYRIDVWVLHPQCKFKQATSWSAETVSAQTLTSFAEPRGTRRFSNTTLLRALNSCNTNYRFPAVQESYTKIVPEGTVWIVPLKHSLFRIRPANADHNSILAEAGRKSSPAALKSDTRFFRKWIAIYTTTTINDPHKGSSRFLSWKSYGSRFVIPGKVNFVDVDPHTAKDLNHSGKNELSEVLLFAVTPLPPTSH